MRGSLIHDVGYQLLRWDLIPHIDKDHIDRELQRVCLEDGTTRLRAWLIYQGVKRFGSPATMPSHRRNVYFAP